MGLSLIINIPKVHYSKSQPPQRLAPLRTFNCVGEARATRSAQDVHHFNASDVLL